MAAAAEMEDEEDRTGHRCPAASRACLLASAKLGALDHTILLHPQSSLHTIELLRDKPRVRKMAGLQRSSQTFRRSGSSGLVWDERLMSEDHNQRDQRTSEEQEGEALELKELRHSRSVGSIELQRRRNDSVEHSRCNNSQAFHTRRVPPALDPPSPKVPGCIFCGIFRKAGPSEPSKPRRY